MKIALDADHSQLAANLDRLVRAAAEEGSAPIEVIMLSFDSLRPTLATRLKDIREQVAQLRKERASAVLRRARRDLNAALRRDIAELKEAEAVLYHDARAVATSLNITRGEQRMLLEVGGDVVGKNRELLRQHVVDGLAPRTGDGNGSKDGVSPRGE